MTNTREQDIKDFIKAAGWGDAHQAKLAGDASFRKYDRLQRPIESAVLMDAPPPHEDVRPFIKVTQYLESLSLSAPKIIHADEEKGLLLLEDLGDESFSRALRHEPVREGAMYMAAMEVLDKIYHAHVGGEGKLALPELPPYDMAAYERELALFSDWFLPQVLGQEKAASLRAEYLSIWRDLIAEAGLQKHVPVLRDYHADNLFWLERRNGVQRVGLLDYQDALIGDAAYDVVSYLEDARRDVAESAVNLVLQYYLRATRQDKEDFMRRYAVLGAQRNLKIVGIFVRLCVRDGKPQYLEFLPRLWWYLEKDLSHPYLAPMKTWIDKHVPAAARGVIQISHKQAANG